MNRKGACTRSRQHGRPPAWPRWLIVLLLCFGVPAALRTLAYANPPDPTWFAGLYDDGDHDDAVLLAMSIVGASSGAPPTLARVASGVGAPLHVQVPPPRAVFRALEFGRAPPAADVTMLGASSAGSPIHVNHREEAMKTVVITSLACFALVLAAPVANALAAEAPFTPPPGTGVVTPLTGDRDATPSASPVTEAAACAPTVTQRAMINGAVVPLPGAAVAAPGGPVVGRVVVNGATVSAGAVAGGTGWCGGAWSPTAGTNFSGR